MSDAFTRPTMCFSQPLAMSRSCVLTTSLTFAASAYVIFGIFGLTAKQPLLSTLPVHSCADTGRLGKSIQGNIVKQNTVRGHLRAAAMYVQSVGLRTDCPMMDPDTGKLFDPIGQCLRDFKRWEAMPKRCNPLTKKMVRDLLEFCTDFPQDSKEKAFVNWCFIGLHMGYRSCKWAAEKALKHCTDLP
jgi:hypothetical protein